MGSWTAFASVLLGVMTALVLTGTTRLTTALAIRGGAVSLMSIVYGGFVARMVLTAVFFALVIGFLPAAAPWVAAGYVIAAVAHPAADLVRVAFGQRRKGGR